MWDVLELGVQEDPEREGLPMSPTDCISHETNSSTTWNKEVTDGYASICTERFIRQD